MSAVADPTELSEPWSAAELAALRRDRRPLHRLAGALLRTPSLLAGTALLGGFGVLGLVAWAQFGGGIGTLQISFVWANQPNPSGPTLAHPFGVMNIIGIDIAYALYQSIPWDLGLVGSILVIAIFLGTVAGSWAGYAHGPVDWAVTSAVDLLLSVPPFFLVIILFVGLYNFVPVQDTLGLFVLLFAAVLWPYYARPVRARAESVTAEPYVEAAHSVGSSRGRTLLRHVLPNALDPVFAQVPIDVYQVFFVLTVFPFLGCFGGNNPGHQFNWVTPLPTSNFPEWGNLLAQGACYGLTPNDLGHFWWMWFFPALVLLLFGVAVALTTDGLSVLFQPRESR